jgi:hypothetical protein
MRPFALLHTTALKMLGKILAGFVNRPAVAPAVAEQRPLQYQLALQFPGASPAHYLAMTDLARQLSAELGSTAMVAGHDMGAGATSIFIHTADAPSTFKRCKPLLELEDVTAAFRSFDVHDYQVLWPLQFQGRFAVA